MRLASPVRHLTGGHMTEFEITQVSPERYRLSGELDMATAETLRDALDPVVQANGRLVLDVGEITFIDSSGLRALLQLSEQMNGSAPLVLSQVPPSVRRLLDVARTAYRLWEMEAAKPSPDRWRLIAGWLGVSISTMLLGEDLIGEEDAAE